MLPSQSTRQAILSQLRYRAMTVAELQSALGLTRNAVMLPLAHLERAGLVRRLSVERAGRVGKPSQRYELAPEEFELTSPAYQAIAPHLLSVIGTPEAADITAAMEVVGRHIHDDVASSLPTKGAIGFDSALDFLQTQGAEIEVQEDKGDTMVLSHSCPIGKLVRTDRHICNAIASFLTSATGAETTSQCIYADKLTCRFRLKRTARGGDL
jgi:predicted ArsR family transcriptional regulator